MHNRILLAEDDPNIRMGLVDALESENYEVVQTEDGDKAIRVFNEEGPFDLILLDVMMPGQSGYDVCREIRRTNEQVPIIMVTAKAEEIDAVVGLKLGADDYVTKPFGVHELLARVQAALRRVQHRKEQADTMAPSEVFSFGAATVDPSRYTITRDEKNESLTPTEMKLLLCFHNHPDQVLTRDQLLNDVWGVNYYGTTRTLDQHVARLRKKVEPEQKTPSVLITVHGVGYRYIPAP